MPCIPPSAYARYLDISRAFLHDEQQRRLTEMPPRRQGSTTCAVLVIAHATSVYFRGRYDKTVHLRTKFHGDTDGLRQYGNRKLYGETDGLRQYEHRDAVHYIPDSKLRLNQKSQPLSNDSRSHHWERRATETLGSA